MASITVRSIPENTLERVRALAATERRSLNSELLMLIERGLLEQTNRRTDSGEAIAVSTQVAIWKQLTGHWDDERTTEQIVADIRSHRSRGRTVDL